MTEALQGLGIVVTRPAHQTDALCEMISDRGGRPIACPTLEICATQQGDQSAEVLSDLSCYKALLFVSANAVEFGLPLLTSGLTAAQQQGLEIIAVGEKTAQCLEHAGVSPVIYPAAGSGSEAVLELPVFSAQNIGQQAVLIIRGNGGRELIADTLRQRGARPRYLEVYHRRCPQPTGILEEDWNRQALHLIICTSVEGLQNLQCMVGEGYQLSLLETPLLVASARIEARALELGFKEVTVAANATDEEVLDTLINWAEKQSTDTAVRNATMNDEKKLDEAQLEETQNDESQLDEAQIEEADFEELPAEDALEEQAPEEGTVIDEPPAQKSSGSSTAKIAWIVCVVLILALGGTGYWINNTFTADRQANEEKLAASAASLAASEKRVTDMQQQVQALSGKLDGLSGVDKKNAENITATASHVKVLEDMVSKNSRRQANTSSDWIIAEADYLLSVGANRLQMERDVKTALSAVQAADDRLKSLAEPGVIPIRQELMSAINDLRGVQDVDINGLALYLADLVGRVESLPLKKGIVASAAPAADAPAEPVEFSLENWRPLLEDVWGELKTLVVIRKQAVPDAMLFDPDRHYYLYQNLRLELASARLSVLRVDSKNMQASLQLVIGWLTEFFNTDDASVAGIIEALEKMQKLDLAPPLPDISATRGAIASYMEQQGAR